MHVKHVLSAQKNILSMSNNFTTQLDKLNKADKADPNIPIDDLEEVMENRRYDSAVVREIASTVTRMQTEIKTLKDKVEYLIIENKRMKDTKLTSMKPTANNKEEISRKTSHPGQSPGRNTPNSQPSRTSQMGGLTIYWGEKKKRKKKKYPQ